jgi:hypothetical protein
MNWWARRSDVKHERVWHVVCPAVVGGFALIASAYVGNPVLAAVALTICAMGLEATVPTFWTLPTGFLTGPAAAGGIALINSIGNLGGFFGPYARLDQGCDGRNNARPCGVAAGPIIAGAITLLMGHDSKMEMAGNRMMVEGAETVVPQGS